MRVMSVFDGSGNHGLECDHLGKYKKKKETSVKYKDLKDGKRNSDPRK